MKLTIMYDQIVLARNVLFTLPQPTRYEVLKIWVFMVVILNLWEVDKFFYIHLLYKLLNILIISKFKRPNVAEHFGFQSKIFHLL